MAFIGTMFTAHILFFYHGPKKETMFLLNNGSQLILVYVLMFMEFYSCPELIAGKL